MICIIYVSDVTFLSNQINCESVTNLSYFFKFTNLRLFFNATDLVLNSNSMPVLCIHTRMQWLNSNWHILIRMCIWPKKSHPELDDLSKSIFTIHLISTHVFYTHCLLSPLRELRMDMRQKEDGLLTGTVASLQKLIYVNVKLDKKNASMVEYYCCNRRFEQFASVGHSAFLLLSKLPIVSAHNAGYC